MIAKLRIKPVSSTYFVEVNSIDTVKNKVSEAAYTMDESNERTNNRFKVETCF